MENSTASAAPATHVRKRQANDPFISTQDTASDVNDTQTESIIRPVARPQSTGKVPDMAMRKPQLISGSKLSFWISWFRRLYDWR
jgi:hypothetical protein